VWIDVGNVNARVTQATDAEIGWLRAFLTFESAASRFTGTAQHLINKVSGTFPAGIMPLVRSGAAHESPPIQIDERDLRAPKIDRDAGADLAWLRGYQRAALEAMIRHERGIISIPTGGGKCLAPETMVVRADGSQVRADGVRVGDRLLGPAGDARIVRAVTRGRGELFRIIPNKGAPWVCNDVHVLTLINTTTGNIVDVPLDVYLLKSRTFKHEHKLFQPGALSFENECESPPIDPYFLGVWYGDGRKNLRAGVEITKPDPEVRDLCQATAAAWGLRVRVGAYAGKCPAFGIVGGKGCPNTLLRKMRQVVTDVTRIPDAYMRGSLDVRRQFLAGMLDTDGYLAGAGGSFFEIAQRHKTIIDDLAAMARSLGFRVTIRPKTVNGVTYWRANILGDFSDVPMRIPRKIQKSRDRASDPRRTGFKVEAIGVGEYAGFTLDGDGRFLLGDFTVTHNSELFIGASRALPGRWLMLVHRTNLATQAAARFDLRAKEHGRPERAATITEGKIGGTWADTNFIAATYKTLLSGIERGDKTVLDVLRHAQGVLCDECHVTAANTHSRVLRNAQRARYRFGFSGTPLDRADQRSIMAIAMLGPVVYRIQAQALIDAGAIVAPAIRVVECRQFVLRYTWPDVQLEGIVRSKKRNDIVMSAAVTCAKPGLVFVNRIEHGSDLTSRLRAEGIKARFVWGKDDGAARDAAIADLRAGVLDVVVCSTVFTEGADIPEIRSVIVGGGGKSVIGALQRVGRGVRNAPGKKGVTVYDVNDLDCGCLATSLPHQSCKWLAEHAAQRIAAYRREGYAVTEERWGG